MASNKSLFIGPTKSQTKYMHTDHFSLSLLNSLYFPELPLLTLSSETPWLAPHQWPPKRIPLFSLTLQEVGRTCIGSLLDEPNYWWSQHHQFGAVHGEWGIQTFIWNHSPNWFRQPDWVQYSTRFCNISFCKFRHLQLAWKNSPGKTKR